MYFNICPRCGAHLDPGERCDCEVCKPAFRLDTSKKIREEPDGQLKLNVDRRKNAQLI